MMLSERIQAVVHALEVRGDRWVNYLALALVFISMAVWYDTHCYHNFNSPEAMDAAQVGRNLAEGRGFTTDFVRPFSIYLLQKHNGGASATLAGTNGMDPAELNGPHPDLANAPLYPLALAGYFKLINPDWKVEIRKPFWSNGGRFERYRPEFYIAILNQMLLLAVILLTFVIARRMLDIQAAWLCAVLMLFSDDLWKFSVSGLPVLLEMVLFLGVVWCLTSFLNPAVAENAQSRRRFAFALLAGLFTGLGMLTRYSFGWAILPVFLFFVWYGGQRRMALASAALVTFAVIVAPWIVRNEYVSGTVLGTAGYAILENTGPYGGSRLMQSLAPDLVSVNRAWATIYPVKFLRNAEFIFRNDLISLGGGLMGVLFLAGLLLGLRNVIARRLRYFTVLCAGLFLAVTALGRTDWFTYSPDMNAENSLALLTPLAVIFGVAFFLTLLNQMAVPSIQIRYLVIGLVIVLARIQFAVTLLPPRSSPIAYPPYYPPELQQFSGWLKPNELMMSDIPWAVAWYGHHQCVWTTINSHYEFYQLNDYVKPVSGLYLSLNTLDSRLFTECLQGGAESWGNFVLRTIAANQIPQGFPLRTSPTGVVSGLFLTDHERWQTE